MIFDEDSLKIMGKSFGWTDKEINTFIGTHFKTLMDYTNKTAFAYLAENDPERMDEINALFESDSEQDKIKGFKVMNDQIGLLLTSYPDLKDKLNDTIKEYETNMLFEFLANGSEEGALELIKYMGENLKKLDIYLKVLKTVQERVGKSRVNDVLKKG